MINALKTHFESLNSAKKARRAALTARKRLLFKIFYGSFNLR